MDYMERALALARRALGRTSPNPAVGAVLVREGRMVGEGYTQPPGAAHAEIVALRQAGPEAQGATLYVTLEPCCHQGRTPPCIPALIQAGVARVHLATLDPNPLVNGQGREQLEAAGIATVVGEHEAEARELNEAFFKHITTGRPFVSAKYAMSLDGKIATRGGDSRWISSAASRRLVHRLRDSVDAVMIGVGTALADDPLLTARVEGPEARPDGRQPLRVVVDSRGRLPVTARLLHQPGSTLLATTQAMPEAIAAQIQAAGAQVLRLPGTLEGVDLEALLVALGQRQVTSVLAEGGAQLLGSLFDRGLVDKVYTFVAPLIMGGAQALSAVAGRGVDRVSAAPRLQRLRVEHCDGDILLIGYLGEPW